MQRFGSDKPLARLILVRRLDLDKGQVLGLEFWIPPLSLRVPLLAE